MEGQEEQLLRISEPEPMGSVTMGRVMSTLLAARSKKLQESISRLSPDSRKAPLGSVDESLWFLHNYVGDAVEREAALDEFLVPMIGHTLRSKEAKCVTQPMMLLNWLFQDEIIFEAVAENLTNIIMRDDRYIALGWCVLVRAILEYESSEDQYSLSGIKEKHTKLLKRLCACIHRLVSLLGSRSIWQDGSGLPSRLSVCAADCLLSLTGALTKDNEIPTKKPKLKGSNYCSQPISLSLPGSFAEKKERPALGSEALNMDMKYSLWNHLEELIHLVQILFIWNKRSRPLHARGVEQVLKWLQEVKRIYSGSPSEVGSKIFKTGALLLSSCWKHYSVLLRLEDKNFPKHCKQLLEQYTSGIQYYTKHCRGDNAKNKTGVETRKFFLNCMCLLLGRFEARKFDSVISEHMQLVCCLLSQLDSDDEDVILGVVSILKAALFRPQSSSKGGHTDNRQMEVVLPSLLHLLDERDGTAKAVILLIAEYCCISTDDNCLQEVLRRLDSGNVTPRKNAIDVISEIIRLSNDSSALPCHVAWKDVANCLLKCLGDEETVVHERTVDLLKLIDPSLVISELVNLVCCTGGKVQSPAADALLGVLKLHKEDSEVICMLLDHLSNIQSMETLKAAGQCGQGIKYDIDRVLTMLPEWSKYVQNWESVIEPLIHKLFAEPSNATIVRFLSYINEQLAESADFVLHLVLSYMKGQKEVDDDFLSRWENGKYRGDDAEKMGQCLFERLCPLLILRLLPLKVFNDLDSSIMYGQLLRANVSHEGAINITDHECLAAFLLNRAFSNWEFEDVRKLSAELCGRIHPQVLYPAVCFHLEEFNGHMDAMKIKACLFSLCTSLVIRSTDSLSHPTFLRIQKCFERILLWPSSDGDQISKAQHGCIDCLALMICSEVQALGSPKSLREMGDYIGERNGNSGVAASRNSALTYVIKKLVQDTEELQCNSNLDNRQLVNKTSVASLFRVCMANVLISACQKVSDPGKKQFARKTFPPVIHFIEAASQPEVRAACIQVLFTAVYHLKSAVLPYASDLLKISLGVLEQGSEKEKLAGAKLMASLMASEDAMLERIIGGLLEARSVLSKVSATDPSLDVREVCKKLLACITSS